MGQKRSLIIEKFANAKAVQALCQMFRLEFRKILLLPKSKLRVAHRY